MRKLVIVPIQRWSLGRRTLIVAHGTGLGVIAQRDMWLALTLGFMAPYLPKVLISSSSLATSQPRLQLLQSFANFIWVWPVCNLKILRLKYLNLSYSIFSGQVPYELPNLSELASLDLSSWSCWHVFCFIEFFNESIFHFDIPYTQQLFLAWEATWSHFPPTKPARAQFSTYSWTHMVFSNSKFKQRFEGFGCLLHKLLGRITQISWQAYIFKSFDHEWLQF